MIDYVSQVEWNKEESSPHLSSTKEFEWLKVSSTPPIIQQNRQEEMKILWTIQVSERYISLWLARTGDMEV